MSSLQDVIASLSDQLAASRQAELRRILIDKGLVEVKVTMGGPQKSTSSLLRAMPVDHLTDDAASDVLSRLSGGKSSFAHRRRRADLALYWGIGTACATLLALIAVFVMNPSIGSAGVTQLATALTGVITAAVLVFYRTEEKALREQESILQVERFLELASVIEEPNAKAMMHARIAELISRQPSTE